MSNTTGYQNLPLVFDHPKCGCANVYKDEALSLSSQVLSLNPPAERTLRAYKRWFEPKNGDAKLRGSSKHILDEEGDLIALRVPAARDRFTDLVQTFIPGLFVVGSNI